MPGGRADTNINTRVTDGNRSGFFLPRYSQSAAAAAGGKRLQPSVSTVSPTGNQSEAGPRDFGPADRTLLAQRLGSLIADAADADQWAMAGDGLEDAAPADFEELIPHGWLIALNGGRDAVYRMALPVGGGADNLGVVRLATIRPCGFHPDQVTRAQAAANWAAEVLWEALSR